MPPPAHVTAERLRDSGPAEVLDHTAVPLLDAVNRAHPGGIDAILGVVNDADELRASRVR